MSQAPAKLVQKNELENRSVTFTPFGEKSPLTISVGMVRNMLCRPTKQGHLPSDDVVMSYLVMARSMQLNPFVKDCYLVGYDAKDGPEFSIITAHQAFLKRAEVHPEYDGMESGVIVKTSEGDMVDREGDFTHEGDTLMGGWAVVFFKTRKHPTKRRLNLNVMRKDNNFWRSMPAGMIVKCAEADALRSSFPTLLGGLMIEAELRPDDVPIENQGKTSPAVRQVIAKLGMDKETQKESKPEPAATNGPPAPADNGDAAFDRTPVSEAIVSAIKDEAKRQFGERAWAKDLAALVHQRTERRNLEDITQEQGQEILDFLHGGPEPGIYG